MPSFTNMNCLPRLEYFTCLNCHHQQLTTTSIIGNWHLGFQNTSIAPCLDLCGIARRLCTCPVLFFQQTRHLSESQRCLNLAKMAIADVLFIPWPSWAKLSFVR
jgi:hypothetical protein